MSSDDTMTLLSIRLYLYRYRVYSHIVYMRDGSIGVVI